MANYVEYDFLKKLAAERRKAFAKEDEEQIGRLRHLENIIRSLRNRIKVSQAELQCLYLKDRDGEKLEPYEALLLSVTDQIGGTSVSWRMDEFKGIDQLNDFYFFEKENSRKLEKEYGIITQGIDFKLDSLFWRTTAINEVWTCWKDYEKSVLPTNAMIIVDPYIFTPVTKKTSVIEFLQMIVPDKMGLFHLTIISTSQKKGDSYIPSEHDLTEFEAAFEKLKIQYEFILIPKEDYKFLFNHKENPHKRLFITPHSITSIDNPFYPKTIYSQLFIGAMDNAGSAQSKEIRICKEILFYKNVLKNIPDFNTESKKKLRYKSTPLYKNRIFEIEN